MIECLFNLYKIEVYGNHPETIAWVLRVLVILRNYSNFALLNSISAAFFDLVGIGLLGEVQTTASILQHCHACFLLDLQYIH